MGSLAVSNHKLWTKQSKVLYEIHEIQKIHISGSNSARKLKLGKHKSYLKTSQWLKFQPSSNTGSCQTAKKPFFDHVFYYKNIFKGKFGGENQIFFMAS